MMKLRIFALCLLFVGLACVARAQMVPGISNPMMIRQPPATGGAIGTPTSIGNGTSTTTGTTSTFTTSASIATSNLVVICVMRTTVSFPRTITSVSDGTNSYTQAVTQDDGSGSNVDIWYKANAASVSSGATVTVTWNVAIGAGGTAINMSGMQVTGILASSPLDKTNGVSDLSFSTPTVTTTTGTLSQAKELLVGGAKWSGTSPPTYTTPSGFTNFYDVEIDNSGLVTRGEVDYQIVNSTGSVTYNPTWSAIGFSENAAIATFKGS